MMESSQLRIVPFSPEYQEAARRLILEGLGEHWGWIDEDINTDLADIAGYYACGHMVLGFIGETLVATGALLPECEGTMRVVRMSVRKVFRRQGIASQILDHLVQTARDSGARRLVLATDETWDGVIAFYKAYGFTEQGHHDGDIHFALGLA